MKKILKLIIALAMCVPMLLNISIVSATSLSEPTMNNGISTWDCIYFGHYKQSKNSDGTFNNDPIKWRVLSVDGNDALVIADNNLDARAFNESYYDVTWENCTLRSWLNGYSASSNLNKIDYSNNNFIDTAFTSAEQEAIKTTTVFNDDNPEYGTDGGNKTSDKIYLLSIDEITNADYGFESAFYEETNTRTSVNTAYISSLNSLCASEGENNICWLRTIGSSSTLVSAVNFNGTIYPYGYYNYITSYSVRPVLNIDLSSTVWSYAGTVTSCNHTWNAGVVTQKATCTSKGVKTYTCSVCGATKTESIAKISHSYTAIDSSSIKKASTSSKKSGYYYKACCWCGKKYSSSTPTYYAKTLTILPTSYVYSGSANTPEVTVKDSKEKAISSDYYTVTYSSNKSVGTAKVTVKMNTLYTGTLTKTFKINPAGTELVNLTPASKAFTAKWTKQSTQTTGYQICYSTSSKFSSPKYITVSGSSKTSYTKKSLSKKKKYYVRIRTYKTVSKTKYYSSWSKAMTVTTK